MHHLVTVKAQLINKSTGEPLYSDGLIIKLFDQDLMEDDFLGQGKINTNGTFSITFDPKDVASTDSPLEKDPDLYFMVYKFGELIYKSKVFKNFNIQIVDIVTSDEQRSFDLDKFEI